MNRHFILRPVCPVCGAASFAELHRTPFARDPLRAYLAAFYGPQGGVEFDCLEDQDYILVECVRCGLIYQREIPGEPLMRRIYEHWIDPVKAFELHERSRRIADFARLSAEIIGIVTVLDRPPMDLTLLDCSMGWGHWCRIAASFGCAVDGTEFSQPRVDYARSRGVHVIDVSELQPRRYDFINAEQVFEHLPNPQSTLGGLVGSLAPAGLVKINVPNGWGIRDRLSKGDWTAPKGSPDNLNAVAPLEHINCFTHAALVRLAAGAGLAPVSVPLGRPALPRRGRLPDRLRDALRPLWRGVRGRGGPPSREGTYLFFRRAPDGPN